MSDPAPIFDGEPPDAIDIAPEDIVPPPTSNSLPPLGEPEMPPNVGNGPPPMAYVHLCDIWTLMKKEARETTEGWVWEGTTTALFDRLDKGRALYTQVTTRLKNMGCIHQVRRGGGPQPSVWLVLKPPTLEDFYNSSKISASTPKQARQRTGADRDQQLRDLNRRVTNIEEYLRSHDVPI